MVFSEFERILKRYEAEPHLAVLAGIEYLRQAAQGPFPSLQPRVVALAKRLDEL
jgi:hypothetical protein